MTTVYSNKDLVDLEENKAEDREGNEKFDKDRNEENADQNINEPKVGMAFDSVDDMFEYYRKYANEKGFLVKKRTSKRGDDGLVRWVTLACSREGKRSSTCKISFGIPPNGRTNCNAKLNAVLCPDLKWRITLASLDHNHAVTLGKSRHFRSNRVITSVVKTRFQMNNRAVRANKKVVACVVEADGHKNVPFLEKHCYNDIDTVRRLKIGEGDALAIQNYFLKMQANNSNFFYVLDFNEGRLKNLFWADARCRAAYEEFGDVIAFDTMYLTNKYNMPFGYFVGVNHHGQAILLGCALISNEDSDTFTWVFKSWLSCMNDHAPCAIITPRDIAMKNSIESVFPNSRHRWCLWNIMKKLLEKLERCDEYESMKSSVHCIIYDSLTPSEFETSWNRLIENFNPEINEWLSGLYNERHQWVPAFVNDAFWAGMSTTLRSESMDAFFDGYVNLNSTVGQFVKNYGIALRSKVEKENQQELRTFKASLPCVTKYKIEKQYQDRYTNAKFMEIQEEMKGKLYCTCSFSPFSENGNIHLYKVHEQLVGIKEQDVTFTVSLNPVDRVVNCNCCLFESRGILCRHSLTVLISKKVEFVPEKYILQRWRKDVKRCYTKVKTIYPEAIMNPENERAERMCNAFYEVVDLAAGDEDKTKLVMDWITVLVNELKKGGGACESGRPTPLNTPSSQEDNNVNTKGSATISSSLSIHKTDLPGFKRHQEMTEKFVQEKKKRVKEEKECVSSIPQDFQDISAQHDASQGIFQSI